MAQSEYIPFKDKKTAKEYESLIEVDQWVEVPVLEAGCSCKAYRGMISEINSCAAKRYVDQGGNLIRKKAAPTTDKP